MLTITLLMVLFFGLILLRIPVALVLFLISVIYVITHQISLVALAHVLTGAMDSFVLLAVPLFILAANLMTGGKITDRIVDFAKTIVGHFPGGLGHVNVLASLIFSGMSGSSVADAGGLGIVEIKMMREGGYDLDFSSAVTASSAIIGPIFPPSIPMVIYAVIARESVGRLFLGGATPGLLLAGALMTYIYLVMRKRKDLILNKATLLEAISSLKRAFLPLMTPIIIVGGIVSGFFTPTEAAAVAATYAFVLGRFVYRELSWKQLYKILYATAVLTAVIMFIMAMATLWAWMITTERVALILTQTLPKLTESPILILVMLNFIILALGMFIEPLAIMMMTLPVILPILELYHISPVLYGVIMSLGVMIGMCTPPYGENLFMVCGITGLSVASLSRAIVPFYVPMVAVLFLITFFPSLVMWLPSLLMGS